MISEPDVYRALQQHLDRMAVGFSPTQSGVELRILAQLLSPAEAELALELSAIPEPLATIHGRVRGRMTFPALREALDAMATRGVINKVAAVGTVRYGKLPFAIGIYEPQLPRLTAQLERDCRQYFEEAFGRAFHTGRTTQTRTVPVNVDITPARPVASYDDIRSHVAQVVGPFAVMTCICRHSKDLLGDPCRQTRSRGNCLTIGLAAKTMIDGGAAREISREAFLEAPRRSRPRGARDPAGEHAAPAVHLLLLLLLLCCGRCSGGMSR